MGSAAKVPSFRGGPLDRSIFAVLVDVANFFSVAQPTTMNPTATDKPKTDFAMIPDDADLASIDRDVRFFPTDNDDPATLSKTQIETWNHDGYLGPLEVLPRDQADDLKTYFDEVLRKTVDAGGDSYSISSAHLKLGRIYDLMSHPKIVGYVTDLLGPNVVGWGAHFFCKMPGDGKRVDWHQDCIFWPLTPTKSVTVWLGIDDATVENGCMEVYLGSHQDGMIGFEKSDAADGNVLNQTIKNPEQYGTWQQTPIPAGQISIHSDLLIHGSAPNTSPNRRCGLTLRYCPADVVAHLGWNAKGIVVSGTAGDHWPGAVRPTTD